MSENGVYVEYDDDDNDVWDGALYKPKQPSVTNRIARNGRNTGVANLINMMIIITWKSDNLIIMMIKMLICSPIHKREYDCEATQQGDHSHVNCLKHVYEKCVWVTIVQLWSQHKIYFSSLNI